MLRTAALLLVLANLAFFAWTRGWLEPGFPPPRHGEHEPQRLAAQINPADVATFKQTLEDHFATTLEEAVLAVPHAKVGLVMSQLHESVKLLEEKWDGWGARLLVRGPDEVMGRLRGLIGPVDPPPFEEVEEA